MDSVYALRALAVSAIISVVLAFAHVGFRSGASRVVFHSQDGQLWAGQRWSDMNNMYGWLVEKHVVAQEDFTRWLSAFPIFHHGA
jgi:hypothetical protein